MADISTRHRIAATFNSVRYRQDPNGFYQLLRNTRTIETDGIRSVSKISEDGRWVEVDEIVGNQHVSEDTQGLVIYVPVDEEAQDFCFCSVLAPDLAGWLTRDPLTNIGGEGVNAEMVSVLCSVLVAELYAVDHILNHRGIIQISISYEEISNSEKVATGQSFTLGSASEQPTQAFTSPRRAPSNHSVQPEEPPRTPALRAQFRSSALSSPEQGLFRSTGKARQTAVVTPALSTTAVPDDEGYRRLLDRALQSARMGAFPTYGPFDTSGLTMALPREDYPSNNNGSALRSLDRLERDKRVGAAGELYVQHIYSLFFFFSF